MLLQLDIQDFTLLQKTSLHYQSGMTVITGESGAGKSLMLDALQFCLGKRSDKSIIRPGAKQAAVTAYFSLANNLPAKTFLNEGGFDGGHDECFVHRTLNQDNRSRTFINDRPVTLQTLRQLGQYLVNIHGQHDNQQLLQAGNQREMLDQFGNTAALVAKTKDIYQQWKTAKQALAELAANQQDQAALALLQYQLQELEECAVGEGEVEQLHQQQQRLAHAEEFAHTSNKLVELFDNEDNAGANNLLEQAQTMLNTIKSDDKWLPRCQQAIDTALIHCAEAMDELKTWQDSIDIDPESLHEVELRLDTIHKIARKHQLPAEQLVEHTAALAEKLALLGESGERQQQLEQTIAAAEKEYFEQAKALTVARKKAAKRFCQKVAAILQQLALPNARFDIEFTAPADKQPRPAGNDNIQFLVSTNPGQPMAPLSKVASGGELSRVSLAIHTMSDSEAEQTYIFDEVDVGIGGQTAAVVGQLLKKLSAKQQLLTITHQAQVAAFANHHYRVEKAASDNATTTEITLLSEQDKVSELARMLGGIKISAETLKHAQSMLEESVA